MRKKDYRKLEKKLEKIEENLGSFENFVVVSTFGEDNHTMIVEEEFSKNCDLQNVYDDNKELELADLYDYQVLGEEYGRFGKKRRYIFR
jgi:hypothetical protein